MILGMAFPLCDSFAIVPRHLQLFQRPLVDRIALSPCSTLPLQRAARVLTASSVSPVSVNDEDAPRKVQMSPEETQAYLLRRITQLQLTRFEAELDSLFGPDGDFEVMDAEVEKEVCCKILSTRLPDLQLNRCRVGPSPLHGMGVFATCDIKCGDIITLYPGDAVLQWQDERQEVGDVAVLFGSHVPQSRQDVKRVMRRESRGYTLEATDTISIVGDPALCTEMAYVGHMCNDGAFCESNEGRAQYEEETAQRMNAEHCLVRSWSRQNLPVHFWTRAKRDIAKDEEILVSYGFGYWFTHKGDVFASSATELAKSLSL
jgi:hypothetical protein